MYESDIKKDGIYLCDCGRPLRGKNIKAVITKPGCKKGLVLTVLCKDCNEKIRKGEKN